VVFAGLMARFLAPLIDVLVALDDLVEPEATRYVRIDHAYALHQASTHLVPSPIRLGMDTPVQRAGDDARSDGPQPRPMRVIAWLVVALGAWGVIEGAIGFAGGKGLRTLAAIENVVFVIAGVALLRGKRWAYVALCLIFVEAFIRGVWFFFLTEAEYSLATRLVVGTPVILVGSVVPLVVLLLPRSRSWFLASRA
jgi:hypothetical protein